MSSNIDFNSATATLDAIQRAAYALSEVMTLDIVPRPDGWACTLHGRSHDLAVEELQHMLRARVVDETLRARIADETAAVRNLVFAVAYSRTGLIQEVSADGAATAR